MFKLIKYTILTFLILVGILILGRNPILTWTLPIWIHSQTGFSASIEKVDLHLTQPTLQLRGLSLRNPSPRFRAPQTAVIRLLEIQYRPLSLLYGETHLTRLYVEIERLTLVHNLQNESNLQWFQKKISSIRFSSTPDSVPFRLDHLSFVIHEIESINESKNTEVTRSLPHGSNRFGFKNLTSPSDIIKIITEITASNPPELRSSKTESEKKSREPLEKDLGRKRKNEA